MMKTPFNDAVETSVSKGSAVPDAHAPSSSGSPISNSPFKDALETKVPNTRTGGVLPEKLFENSVATPVTKPPVPGEKFKIG